MNQEWIRIFGLVITMMTAIVLMIFTAHNWNQFRPPVVRALMVCFNAFLYFLVYGFGEAAQQSAPMGARVFLTLIAVIGTLGVLLVYRRFERKP